jgi:hypothetical protein
VTGVPLLIDAPTTYGAERGYVFDVLLRDRLGIDWQVRASEGAEIRLAFPGDERGIVLRDVLFASPSEDWLTPRALPPRPVAWVHGPTGRLPVLYGPRPAPERLLREDGRDLCLDLDLFGGAFFMLTRYEEVVLASRDSLDRFPASASLAQAEGFLMVPVVDAYVELLWHALRRLRPGLERPAARFRVALTHDVDRPLSFLGRGVRGLAKQVAADIIVRRDGRLLAQRIRSWTGIPRGDHRLDPDNTFDFLMEVSERHGIASAFYFLATDDVSFIDGYYTLDHPWILRLIGSIHRRGHEIGFHSGFQTYRDATRTRTEFARLCAAASAAGVEQEVWGGRQHYLRWENPVTWANWEAAGLDYDSTLTFAEHLGFRAGTCHEFRPFHLHERRALRLRERPLIAMDATALGYMDIGRDEAAGLVVDVARQCRRHEGTLTLLWHNSRVQTARERHWYESLIEAVV